MDMKIEKLNEKQIKIFLNHNDLEERNIKISELAYGSEKAQTLFKDMMEKANEECGFYVDTNRFIIEAIPSSSDSIVLIITKLSEDEDLLDRLGAYRNIKKSEILPQPEHSDICVYAFNTLDIISEVSKILISTYTGENALFKYKNIYYLVLDTSSSQNINTITAILNEYGEKKNASSLSKYFFIEHAETIIKDNAILVLSDL
jgi:adapter protein MecA 1/2